ncbi:hypothetical protein BpHYR1_039932 [Brachionus plicatilis]|uniref:Uncharacterized protein n=1 Tax=Brachionus plicatilis TaxID=10195 RepID=A0A3M7PQA4_BRAPC|nr:hypothetical protein BpHYR1_039932 [Brachionus plicatilis]
MILPPTSCIKNPTPLCNCYLRALARYRKQINKNKKIIINTKFIITVNQLNNFFTYLLLGAKKACQFLKIRYRIKIVRVENHIKYTQPFGIVSSKFASNIIYFYLSLFDMSLLAD